MTTEDLIYLAGYLDGEGSFASSPRGRISIICENTHRPTLEWIKTTFGGRLVAVSAALKKPHWKPSWRWTLCDEAAAELCRSLQPFLREKAAQADILMQIQASKTRGGRRLTQEELIWRAEMAARLKELKHVRY